MFLRPALIGLTLIAALPASAQDAAAPTATADPAGTAIATPEAQPSAEVPGAPASLIAQIAGPDGAALGSAVAAPTASGVMLLTLTLTGLPPGIHGAHIHDIGTCTGPDFDSAGGHLAGDRQHGVMTDGGAHPGDLPNLHVPDSGALQVQFFAPDLTPELMTDADGTALVIHDLPDDYTGQPSGNAGARIACGAFAVAE